MLKVGRTVVKSVLSPTGIPGFDYAVNPYVGCAHGCRYCYASFMKRFTNHPEPWGTFVDVKTNAVSISEQETARKKCGHVILGSVTDAYQPLERKHELTRGILSSLLKNGYRVTVLTKSPLVMRDIDLFKNFKNLEVGFSIGTHDEHVRRTLERNTPQIRARIESLRKLKKEGICTYVFIAPMLPLNVDKMCGLLDGTVDYVMADMMNYPKKIISLLKEKGWDYIVHKEWYDEMCSKIQRRLAVPFEAC